MRCASLRFGAPHLQQEGPVRRRWWSTGLLLLLLLRMRLHGCGDDHQEKGIPGKVENKKTEGEELSSCLPKVVEGSSRFLLPVKT